MLIPDIRQVIPERFSQFPSASLRVGHRSGPELLTAFQETPGLSLDVYAFAMLISDPLIYRERIEKDIKLSLRDLGIRKRLNNRDGWDTLVRTVEREGLRRCSIITAPEMALNDDVAKKFVKEGEEVYFLSPTVDSSIYCECGHVYNWYVFGLLRCGGRLTLVCRDINLGWDPNDRVVCSLP